MKSPSRRIAVVTGTRAEWGILEPVCDAIAREPRLALVVCAGGAHLLPREDGGRPTIHEVEDAANGRLRAAAGGDAPAVERFAMQHAGETGRAADAAALGRGVTAFAELFARRSPDAVLVLGDRIEAFAAASAAAIGGFRVAHVHGGDRAEGVADEAMRHAVSKLAHIHFPASAQSAERLARMGEDAARIHLVGSPSVDGLAAIAPIGESRRAAIGNPDFVLLLHPTGRDEAAEERDASTVLDALASRGRTVALAPNSDPGRAGIARAIAAAATRHAGRVQAVSHLPRAEFLALLRHPQTLGIVGNSSAALIECAALGVRAVNIGSRQSGRERAGNVRDVASASSPALAEALDALVAARSDDTAWPVGTRHPYLDGRASERIAAVLAGFDAAVHALAKRNAY